MGRHVSPGTLRCWPRKLSNPPVNETRRMQGLTGVRIDGIIIFKLKTFEAEIKPRVRLQRAGGAENPVERQRGKWAAEGEGKGWD